MLDDELPDMELPAEQTKPTAYNGKVYLTLFVDASHCGASGAAGWGAWIKHGDKPSRTAGGMFKDRKQNSSHAELDGIANALKYVRNAAICCDIIMVQCDNLQALSLIQLWLDCKTSTKGGCAVPKYDKAKRDSVVEWARPALKVIEEVMQHCKSELILRHVKGHQKGGGRSYTNRICDEIAGRHMRASRKIWEPLKHSWKNT